MAMKIVENMAEYYSITGTKGLVVVDFSASWCGPCRMIGPYFEQLATQYPQALFAKVSEDECPEGKAIIAEAGVRAFPTFYFFMNGQKVDEMKGANQQGLSQMVEKYIASIPQSFEGSGFSLGGTGEKLTPQQAREARLSRFGGGGGGASSAPKVPDPTPNPSDAMKDDDDAELQAALALSISNDLATTETGDNKAMDIDETSSGDKADDKVDNDGNNDKAEMVLPPVDETLLKEVVEMGFLEVRVRKALMNGSSNAEAVVNWVIEHGEDNNIDEPIPLVPKNSGGGGGGGGGGQARSWKCVETGRLFRTMDEVQMYAEKTGRSNFEESVDEKKPLTKDEIAAKMAALKEKIAARKEERGEAEKVDEVEREKQRRTMGKEMAATREQMEKDKRMREYAIQKREKQMQKVERERLRAEIAKDKAERKARGGTLSSVLGTDGYNPSGMSASIAADLENDERAGKFDEDENIDKKQKQQPLIDPTGKPVFEVASQLIDTHIGTISKYKVGGDGGKCLKLLGLYLKNIVEKPDEAKYRSINTESNAFKGKVAGLVGGVALLKTLGFVKNEAGTTLELNEAHVNSELLVSTREKLDAALAKISS
mmetsp:Transcript_49834/g.63838  ORF Transcript_49834/g.63838 Transcript_49834/m.63838 type:complete len:599 (+) Transcript_49834:24-1820(+)